MEGLAVRVRDLLVAEESYRRAVAAAVGISPVEATALEFLLHDGPRPPSLIATRTGLSRTGTTTLVDRLAARGRVARRPHPRDRRSVLVELTDDGVDLVRSTYRLFVQDVHAALDGADPRLREDPEWRDAVGSLMGAMAASLRRRAGDVHGVEAALRRRRGGPGPPGGDATP